MQEVEVEVRQRKIAFPWPHNALGNYSWMTWLWKFSPGTLCFSGVCVLGFLAKLCVLENTGRPGPRFHSLNFKSRQVRYN
jgi:hypothetical protein